MKFRIGDKVRFLNEKGEGTVTKIINKSTVGVTIEDGFEIPFIISELVSVFDGTVSPVSTVKEKTEEPVLKSVSNAAVKKEVPPGIFIALSPEKPEDISRSDFNVWLVNHTGYSILYCISSLQGKGYELIDKGEAKPYESKLIETIGAKKMDLFNTLKVDVLFYNEKPFEHQEPLSEIIKIKPFRLYKGNAFTENGLIHEKAMILNVTDLEKDLYFDKPESAGTDLSKLLFQKNRPAEQSKQSKPHRINNASFEMEIDLHIEELIDNYGGMSNAEIVQVQLRHFQKALDKAVNEHYRTLTVIHGVGNGRLKQEVRAILSSMKLRFHDASYSKYGFGATEVVIG